MANRDDDDEPSYVSDAHRDIDHFANHYVDDDEREEFYSHYMKKTGHKPSTAWGAPDQQGGQDEKGYRPKYRRGAGGGKSEGGRRHWSGGRD